MCIPNVTEEVIKTFNSYFQGLADGDGIIPADYMMMMMDN